MDDYKTPSVNRIYRVETFNGEILLYTEAGTQAVYLNDTAFAVWQLCKENITVGQMVAYLIDAYPGQSDQIRSDVMAALKVLESNNLIEWP